MFPIFFKTEKGSNLYSFYENEVEFKMPLFFMLKLKKFLREETHSISRQPITSWMSTLYKHEIKQIVIVKKELSLQ